MNTIEWTLEGNSCVLNLGNQRLVELITQCDTHFYALILTKPYTISTAYWGKDTYTVMYKGNKIACLYHKDSNSSGNIAFNDQQLFNYQYHHKRGLRIFSKNFEEDAIIYQRDNSSVKSRLSVRIGLEMTNLDVDRLLLLITLGKLLFEYLCNHTNMGDANNIGTRITEIEQNSFQLS